ncbi:MAG: hypothetical protein J6Z31_03950 [Fibrobacter sp.]|nr:hypothetical protein [Fibrobacter sp.]
MFRILLFLLLLGSISFANKDLDEGEYWFKNRARNSKNDHADSLIVEKMIDAYKRALKDSAAEEKAAERLLYAYYFKGCYVIDYHNHEARLKLFDESKSFGEAMHAKFPNNTEITSLYAQNLSLWSSEYGPLQAVKEGVARKIRDLSTEAKNWQFLGRAHQLLPYIPILLNWPDKDLADKFLTLAHKKDPADLNTSLFLAELRLDQNRYEEALKLVEDALSRGVRSNYTVEDKRSRWKLKDLKKRIREKMQ